MLIIARRKGQRVVIGHDIEVVVTEVTRGAIKLGIVAPPHTPILRGELHDAVQEANRAAAQTVAEPPQPEQALPAAVPWGKPT
ncbi:MAG TPA: carbon storage regulator [Polyangiaceae bacterium]